MESLGLSDINYNHIRGGNHPPPTPSPPSRAVGTPCTAGRDGNLIPPGHRRNLRESSKDGQDAINQSQEPDVQRRLHEPKLTQSRNTSTTDTQTPPPPPSHPHTEASGEATVHQTKATASQIWFSSPSVATSILRGPISGRTFVSFKLFI